MEYENSPEMCFSFTWKVYMHTWLSSILIAQAYMKARRERGDYSEFAIHRNTR